MSSVELQSFLRENLAQESKTQVKNLFQKAFQKKK